jgi:hypothetical protein
MARKGATEMKTNSSVRTAAKAATVCGLALAAGFLTTRAKADDWDKKTVIKIDQPMQITDTYLQPGTYVLMLDRYSMSDRHIVRIYNDKQDHLINTVMAFPAYRVRPTGDTKFTFWETPPGTARALRDWYWPGDNFGQEFAYPKQLRQLAVAAAAPAPAAPAAAEEQNTEQSNAQIAEQKPAEQPQEQAIVQSEEIVVAQANPQADQAAQNEQNVNANDQNNSAADHSVAQNNANDNSDSNTLASNANSSSTLPQTASSYPLIGLAGLFSIGMFGLLRVKRSA